MSWMRWPQLHRRPELKGSKGGAGEPFQVVESDAEVSDESLLEAGDVLENMMSLTKTGAQRKVATSILGAVKIPMKWLEGS